MLNCLRDMNDSPPASPLPQVPRPRWRRVLLVGAIPFALVSLLGVSIGLGVFTFGYGQGFSYMRDDPAACANCHVMQDSFSSWQKSSHHAVATCNSCHLPHNAITKWVVKGENGFFHSLAFTTNDYHMPLQIKPRNRMVTQGACLNCHASTVHQMTTVSQQSFGLAAITDALGWPGAASGSGGGGGGTLFCVHCHNDVGHAGRRRGSTTLDPRDPSPGLLYSLFPPSPLPLPMPSTPQPGNTP